MTSDNDTTEVSFPASLRPTLQALVTRATENADGSDEYDFAAAVEVADAGVVTKGLALLGIEVSPKIAYQVWSLISENHQAGWLEGPRGAEDASRAVLGLCQYIADGTDYAGFSGKG
ncbi:hypothetical protein AD929_02060 [Gluconobacter potus]|uniref:Uncharacterized protein n=1 Tax=Gluconobacter potus TaxID=2724927 RepID=A0A149QZE2_9PROT|nr:hypothetical protein [Gluconobacter potus]KXV02675.1 hypothetical protein AD929_02060 [Gluconobacter potus]